MADFTSGKNWGDFYSGILPPAAPAPQPATDWNQFYSGILPSSPAASTVTSPYLTPAEQAQLQQQMQQSQSLQAGYNPNGTPKPAPIRPSWTIPNAMPSAPAVTSLDQAAYDARNKPGTWMAQSRMQAEALMRQMAVQQAKGANPAAQKGGLAALLPGAGIPATTPKASPGGLAALVNTPVRTGATGTGTNGYVYRNGQNVGQSAQYAGMSPAQMYDAINAAAGNRTNSSGGSGTQSMGSNRRDGGTPAWVANAIPLYDSKGNISGYQKNAR